ncbi:MAG TPA: PDZ domain-containing protein [Oculatellaceae cyanobacterium]
MTLFSRLLLLTFCLFTTTVTAVASPMEEGQLDVGPFFKLNAKKRVEQPTAPTQPGVVGLDLLIFPTNYPLVQGVFPDTSAEQQGVLPGDRIVQINRQSTLNRSRDQIDAMISDRIGDRVHLTISRNQQLKDITLTVQPAPAHW